MIGYANHEDDVVICLPKDEKRMLKLYFIKGSREIEEYNRFEVIDFIDIQPRIGFNFDGIWT